MAPFDARLSEVRTLLRRPRPAGLRWEIAGLRSPLAGVTAQRAEIETCQAERVAPSDTPDEPSSGEATRVRLVGIGANDATRLGAELFDRNVRNRRAWAAWAGLVAVPRIKDSARPASRWSASL